MQKPLTDAFLRSVEAPAKGRFEITDLRCNGLTLRVTKGGVKSWSFRFRDPKITQADASDDRRVSDCHFADGPRTRVEA